MARLTLSYIQALDGYPLQIARYEPFRRGPFTKVALINSGAGIPRTFYEPFAAWLADEGVPVVTYDYRGIGGSRGKTIRTLSASIQDWGSKDCAGALFFLRTTYPTAEISIIGHSVGGLVTGFVTTPPQIARMLLICPHTGYSGDYARSSRLKMFLSWHVVMPIITWVAGYFPGRRLGLPEDIPYGVAIEWANRRGRNNATIDAQRGSFPHIAACALTVRPEDDPFSTRSAMQRVQSLFSSTNFKDLTIRADPDSNERIGHFGFFRPSNRAALWPIALQWATLGEMSTLHAKNSGT